MGRRGRCDRRHGEPGGSRRRVVRRRAGCDRPGEAGRRDGTGHRRSPTRRCPPGVGDPARPDRDAGLLRQRAHGRPRRSEPRADHPDPARAHREPHVRRSAAAPGPAQPTGLRAVPRPRGGHRAVAGAPAARRGQGTAHRPRRAPQHRPGAQGGAGLRRPGRHLRRAGRLRAGGPGGEDPRDLGRLRGPTGGAGRSRRRHGPRLDPATLRRDRQLRRARGDDAGGGGRLRTADRRRPAGHDRLGRARAAAAPPERPQAQEQVRVRHPPALAGVLHQGGAARHSGEGDPVPVDGRRREGGGLRPALRLQPRDRHRLPHRGRGGGLADHRRRHAQGADGAQPGVHLRPAADGGRDRAQARRPGDGARSLHEGRRRRGRHRCQAGSAADHHGQQLQRLGRAVGGAPGDAGPRPGGDR